MTRAVIVPAAGMARVVESLGHGRQDDETARGTIGDKGARGRGRANVDRFRRGVLGVRELTNLLELLKPIRRTTSQHKSRKCEEGWEKGEMGMKTRLGKLIERSQGLNVNRTLMKLGHTPLCQRYSATLGPPH